MSKIVDRVIFIPEDVRVFYEEKSKKLNVEGPNGNSFLYIHNSVKLLIEDRSLKTFSYDVNDSDSKKFVGTMNSLIFNLIKGSKENYEVVLEVKGVGYKAFSSGNKITISAGYSHDVDLEIPENIRIDCINGIKIIVKGNDKQRVGWFASKIRDIRRPNVFVKSLKGIFYEKEISGFKIKPGKRDSKK